MGPAGKGTGDDRNQLAQKMLLTEDDVVVL
jgi:hypothetical protein